MLSKKLILKSRNWFRRFRAKLTFEYFAEVLCKQGLTCSYAVPADYSYAAMCRDIPQHRSGSDSVFSVSLFVTDFGQFIGHV